jgi:hypothetical protein
MASDRVEPINILAELVINSANDVLAGYQTWEDHISYLKQMAAEYELQGVRLPLDLTEERNTDENLPLYRRRSLPQSARADRRPEATEKLPDSGQGIRTRNLFD